VDAADTRQLLQVLSYTVKMLQRVPLRQQGLEAAGTGSISFASLWELLLLLALKSEHAVVRCATVECMAWAGSEEGVRTGFVLGVGWQPKFLQLVALKSEHAVVRCCAIGCSGCLLFWYLNVHTRSLGLLSNV
jgi:hypothetical protein